MDAIICSAGKGSRLGELGLYTRKSLFRDTHSDKSILWYQLDALHELGVSHVVVLTPESDTLIPAELARLHDRHPGMKILSRGVSTRNILETIAIGLQHVSADQVVRLDGDVCILNRSNLSALRGYAGNALCAFPAHDYTLNSATPVVHQNRIAFWKEGTMPGPVWSCVDCWRTEDLARLAATPDTRGDAYFFSRINELQDAHPPLKVETVLIPPVYEIDTPEDLALLTAMWDRQASALESESLQYWLQLQEYPPFSVNKEEQLKIDQELVLEFCKPESTLLELGAGPGRLIQPVLDIRCATRYTVVEPNAFWAREISEAFAAEPRVQVVRKTVSEFVADPAAPEAELAVAFGWAPYIVHDASLHRSLSGLKAKRLLLKAPEPPQDRFSRLRVDHFSPELGTRYISLYRSATETCQLVRNAGWRILKLRRNVYPAALESSYGSRNFLIVAERP